MKAARRTNKLVFPTKLPDRSYEELAIVDVSGGGVVTVVSQPNYYEQNISKLKEKAREPGGDAIIDIREFSGGFRLTATIVRWSEE